MRITERQLRRIIREETQALRDGSRFVSIATVIAGPHAGDRYIVDFEDPNTGRVACAGDVTSVIRTGASHEAPLTFDAEDVEITKEARTHDLLMDLFHQTLSHNNLDPKSPRVRIDPGAQAAHLGDHPARWR